MEAETAPPPPKDDDDEEEEIVESADIDELVVLKKATQHSADDGAHWSLEHELEIGADDFMPLYLSVACNEVIFEHLGTPRRIESYKNIIIPRGYLINDDEISAEFVKLRTILEPIIPSMEKILNRVGTRLRKRLIEDKYAVPRSKPSTKKSKKEQIKG